MFCEQIHGRALVPLDESSVADHVGEHYPRESPLALRQCFIRGRGFDDKAVAGRCDIEVVESCDLTGLLLLVVLVLIPSLLFFESHMIQPSEKGFRVYSLQNNALLISDTDVVSYNWTSQEMAITPAASERLTGMADSIIGQGL